MAQTTNSTSSSGSETHWFENVVVLDLDLEGQEVQKQPVVDAQSTPARITRSQSLTRLGIQQEFTHPNSHSRTTEADIVEFDGADDAYQPLNWPFRKKLVTTFVYGLFTMTSTWASSVYSPAIDQVAAEFNVAPEVCSPLEPYGRKAAVLTPVFISACFSFGSATAKDIQTLLLTRFFAGIFGAAPVTNTGGVLSDIWAPQSRGTAIVGYAFAVVGGPTMGPIVGGAITSSYLGWRWTEYITGIMQMAVLIIGAIVLNETYPDALLVAKARRLRHDTGNWALHARHEERNFSFREMVNKFLMRPFRLLGTPICFLMVLYASFVYGILYLCLAAIPVQFALARSYGPVTSELPFLALLLGTIFGGTANILNNKFYTRRFEANDNQPVPEARLPPMMIGSIFFAAGLFIFGWTSSPNIHWVAPCIGLVFMGFGFFTIFQSALNYLIDTFSSCAASAVAAQTFVRAIFAALFPLFVTPMFQNLGIEWGSSVLGFVAAALIPIPFLFYVYGKGIRMKGKFTTK
ncbi:putative mfs multidrug protein [Botrytis cinerea BcDW1]|uniref:Putative mfs multidrug protein n=1 Tax=Botryotinia fuckeliana (strain BcDW1) TaxID=1290391 RepID=M7U2Z5_BOTF1|nr:putative mfs multidrug protein [Botrytis cinerea BcDW1]